jgi:hypothetical protein
MRAIIELRNDQHARLLQLAADRGEKGISALIREAVDRYLLDIELRDSAVEEAVTVIGSVGADEAEDFRARVHKVRKRWR